MALLGIDRSAVVNRRVPKIGPEAADLYYRLNMNQVRFWLSILLIAILAPIGAAVKSGPLDDFLYFLLIPAAFFCVNRFRLRRKYFRSLSKLFGVEITFR